MGSPTTTARLSVGRTGLTTNLGPSSHFTFSILFQPELPATTVHARHSRFWRGLDVFRTSASEAKRSRDRAGAAQEHVLLIRRAARPRPAKLAVERVGVVEHSVHGLDLLDLPALDFG